MLLAADRVVSVEEPSSVLRDLVRQPVRRGTWAELATANLDGWTTWLLPAASPASEEFGRSSSGRQRITESAASFRPLDGAVIAFLRPAEADRWHQHRFALLGARVLHQPLLSFGLPRDADRVRATIAQLPSYDWLVFTSAVGVERFMDWLRREGKDLRALHALRLAAIGPATAAALRRYCLEPDVVPEAFHSECLAETLTPQVRGSRVLLARSDQGRDVLPRALAGVASVDEIAHYHQEVIREWNPKFVADLTSVSAVYVLLTSSNIASQFLNGIHAADRPQLNREWKLVTISPVTSEAVRRAGARPDLEAEVYSLDGMLEVIVRDRLADLAGGIPGKVENDGPGKYTKDVQGDAGPGEGKAQEEVDQE